MADNQSARKASPLGIAFGVFLFLVIILLLAGLLFGWWQLLFR